MAAEDQNGEVVSSQGECTDCDTNASESSFDELARGLARGTISRGRALRILGGTLVGGMLASVPGAAWAVKCKPLMQKCTANTQCCSRNCIKNPNGNGKICGCPTGQTLCNNKCITCNNTGEVVNPSTCQCECPTGQVVCNKACVSRDCSGGRVFNATTCKCECPTGQVVCSGTNTCVLSCDPTTGEVLVFDPDTGNCSCKCPGDTELCGGQCLAMCTPPKTQRNPNNCACECPTATQTCGNNCCAAGTECCGGECRPLCASGEQRNPQSCACEGASDCTGSQEICDIPQPCGPDSTCLCFNTTEGGHLCSSSNICERTLLCDSSSDCPQGYFCGRTCCAQFVTGGRHTCFPRCGTTPLQTTSQAQSESSGGASAALPN